MNMFLTGDKIFNQIELKKISNKIIDTNFVRNDLKQLLRIYLNCSSEYGGAQWFGYYAKKFAMINALPHFTIKQKKFPVLHKKIFSLRKKKLLNKKEFFFINATTRIDNKFIIENNNSKEILEFVKKAFF